MPGGARGSVVQSTFPSSSLVLQVLHAPARQLNSGAKPFASAKSRREAYLSSHSVKKFDLANVTLFASKTPGSDRFEGAPPVRAELRTGAENSHVPTAIPHPTATFASVSSLLERRVWLMQRPSAVMANSPQFATSRWYDSAFPCARDTCGALASYRDIRHVRLDRHSAFRAIGDHFRVQSATISLLAGIAGMLNHIVFSAV